MTVTLNDRAAVGVFAERTVAEEAVRLLAIAGINLQDISIIGHDEQAHEASQGHYLPADHVEEKLQVQGTQQGLWIGGLCGVLLGFGTFLLPGLGILAVLGPVSGLIGGMGVGAIGGDIAGQMTFTDIASEYRGQLTNGNLLVIVHCSTDEEPRVQSVLESMGSLSFSSHALKLNSSHTILPDAVLSGQVMPAADYPHREKMEDYRSPNATAGQQPTAKVTRRHQQMDAHHLIGKY